MIRSGSVSRRSFVTIRTFADEILLLESEINALNWRRSFLDRGRLLDLCESYISALGTLSRFVEKVQFSSEGLSRFASFLDDYCTGSEFLSLCAAVSKTRESFASLRSEKHSGAELHLGFEAWASDGKRMLKNNGSLQNRSHQLLAVRVSPGRTSFPYRSNTINEEYVQARLLFADYHHLNRSLPCSCLIPVNEMDSSIVAEVELAIDHQS